MCINEKFGLLLRNCREDKKLSREKLAEICDISDRCISNIERGVSEPKITMAAKLFIALEVDTDLPKDVFKEFYHELF